MNDEEWFLLIGREIGQQISLYSNSPLEKVTKQQLSMNFSIIFYKHKEQKLFCFQFVVDLTSIWRNYFFIKVKFILQ